MMILGAGAGSPRFARIMAPMMDPHLSRGGGRLIGHRR